MISVLLFVVCGPLQLTHSQLLCDDLSLVMMVFYFNPYWQTSVGMTLLILPTVFCLPIIDVLITRLFSLENKFSYPYLYDE